MNIEITDKLEASVLQVARVHKVTPVVVVESAVTFTISVTRLSVIKQATIHQWIEEEKLKQS